MSRPETLEDRLKRNYFIADHKLVLTMAATKFDEVLKVNALSGEVEGQFMPDLPATKGDCEAIRLSGKKYGITDAGPGDMYIMEDAPTRNQYQQAIRHIVRRLQDNPEKGHLILSCFAGHGIQYFGQ